jgi:hypothetical protein
LSEGGREGLAAGVGVSCHNSRLPEIAEAFLGLSAASQDEAEREVKAQAKNDASCDQNVVPIIDAGDIGCGDRPR